MMNQRILEPAYQGLIGDSPEAAELLGGFNLPLINDSPDVICLLSADLRLLAFNRGWVNFALENGGHNIFRDWGPGRYILEAMPQGQAAELQERYERVLATGRSESFEYECSSPEVLRAFLQVVYPLKGGRGLLVTNSQTIAAEDTVSALIDQRGYRNPHGHFIQCAHCRRIARQDGSSAWDWLPGLPLASVAAEISHTICPYCLEHHHPE